MESKRTRCYPLGVEIHSGLTVAAADIKSQPQAGAVLENTGANGILIFFSKEKPQTLLLGRTGLSCLKTVHYVT